MNIYYIDIEEFKKNHADDFFYQYSDREFKNDKRFYEYTTGRYLVKNAAKKIYKIDNPEIIINESGKPVLKNSELNFSLSHSHNYVLACFDSYKCGIDIELIKNRNLGRFAKYYKKNYEDILDFYRDWTFKEASYKLGAEIKDSYAVIFKNNYYLTVVSEKVFDKNIEIIHFE